MTIPATQSWEWNPAGRWIKLYVKEESDMDVLVGKSHKKHNGYLSFDINLPRKPRSTGPGSASNHFHGHCQQLTMVFDMSIERVKMYIKIRAALELGYPSDMIGGIAVPQSEALASSEEENLLIEMAHIVASERGVSLIEEGE